MKMRFLLSNLAAITRSGVNYKNVHNLLLINGRGFCVTVATAAHTEKSKDAPATATTTTANATPELAQTTLAAGAAQQRSLHIAVIGVPNAGKSTFINNLINHRVCPTSSKVHTTRKANTAICTTAQTQLVFYDTPGLVTQREIKKHNLEQSFKSAYRHAVQHADVIAVMHDVSNAWTRNELHATVLDTLKAYPTLPSFLILNKIDALKSKRILLDTIRTLTMNTLSGGTRGGGKQAKQQAQAKVKQDAAVEALNAADKDKQSDAKPAPIALGGLSKREVAWAKFSDVFLVSSITGNGLNDINDYLIASAKERPWQFSDEAFTDASPESLIVESVRARLLDYLPQEIPYNLQSVIEYYSVEKNTIYASVQVNCPSARIERLICGESNGKLRQITERVTSDLVETFGKPISLTISTRSKKDKKD